MEGYINDLLHQQQQPQQQQRSLQPWEWDVESNNRWQSYRADSLLEDQLEAVELVITQQKQQIETFASGAVAQLIGNIGFDKRA